MRDEVAPSQIRQQRRQTNPGGVQLPTVFFAYEAVIAVLSLLFILIAVFTQRSNVDIIFITTPIELLLSVVFVAAVKLVIAMGIYRRLWLAWAGGIVLGVVGLFSSFVQLLGGWDGFPLWWVFVRFESGGNLFVILDVLFQVDGFQWFVILVNMGVYAVIVHQLYTRQTDFLDLV